jgi:UDP-glucose 4-epimerase
MKKNIIVVTGGAGFVGSNLIELLLKKTNFNLISIDNYSSGFKKNHIINRRIKYIKCHTKDIYVKLKKFNRNIHSLFHFGEFARIYQSFLHYNQCIESNFIGSQEVIRFCLENNIKLIYSATSASLGNSGKDKDLSPYAFTKSRNLELLNNLKKWFNFNFEIVYFYNVYGPKQIKTGKMATVIGIFEHCFKKKIPLPVVKPGTQSRRFTHIKDTVEICFLAWKKNLCRHYAISNKHSYSILQIAQMFGTKTKILPKRKGERYASKLTRMNLSNKIYRHYGKISIRDYIDSFKKNN